MTRENLDIMLYTLILVISALVFPSASGTAPYHTCEAKSGDGVQTMLNRYKLNDHSCNFDKFYELNQLKKDAPLVKGKKYRLPIQVFTYNTKSIRSTLGFDDMAKAVAIKDYNQELVKLGQKAKEYTDDLLLWVPHHLILTTKITAKSNNQIADQIETPQAGIKENQSTKYLIEARSGDGVHSILRRYKLNNHYCNYEKFHSLNELEKNASLIKGRKYILPVMIHQYNGKSIRSTLDIQSWDQAVAIKDYNDDLVRSSLKSANYSVDNKLWVPYHLDLYKEPTITPDTPLTIEEPKRTKKSSKYITQSIFGKALQNVEVVDQSLKGNVYYIVGGHGGPDPGAMCMDCTTPLCEDEYAYDVALRLARDLMQHGAKVEIITQDPNDGIRDDKILKCDKDEIYRGDVKILKHKLRKLEQRVWIINNLYAKYKKQGYKKQQAIMLHVDSNNKNKTQDVFFCYARNSKVSKQLAADIQVTFKQKYEKYQKGRGYKGHISEKGFYVLRKTHPPAVLIELANIQNRSNHQRIMLAENRQALANWIFEGLIKS